MNVMIYVQKAYSIDNRIENLREDSNAENSQNMKRNKNNKTGVVGVCWNNKLCKWSAEITVDLKQIKLGYFTDIHEAIEKRAEAEIAYLTPNQLDKKIRDTRKAMEKAAK